MKIVSCKNKDCHHEKGNYSKGKPKGHLDTQLFPESKGTKYDRNIVKKEEKHKKHTKEAARPKLEQTFDQAFKPEISFDRNAWDSVYSKAKEIYGLLKSSNSPFLLDDQQVKQNIKSQLVEDFVIDDNMANLAAITVLNADAKWRKQQKATQVQSPVTAAQKSNIKKAQVDGNEGVATPSTFRNPFRHNDVPLAESVSESVPEPAPDDVSAQSSQGKETVHVIYPDIDDNGSRSYYKEFDIEVDSIGISDKAIADEAWYALDHPDSTIARQKGVRSPMVGDVFIVRNKPYIALGIGFGEINQEDLEKWKTIPSRNKLSAINEEKLRSMLATAFSNIAIKTAKKECETCQIKTAQSQDVDKNTLHIGKISSVAQAKKICKEKFGRLPRIGYEMGIDKGLVKMKHELKQTTWNKQWGEHNAEYITHLQNNSGSFRCWTYISPSPFIQD